MLNRVVLIGRLTRDVEVRKTTSGMDVASFTLAVDDSRKDKDGNRGTLFMNCSLFGVRAVTLQKYTHKGSLIGIEGRLSQRKFVRKSDNVELTVIETIVDNFDFLEKGSSNASTIKENDEVINESSEEETPSTADVTDEDLPF